MKTGLFFVIICLSFLFPSSGRTQVWEKMIDRDGIIIYEADSSANIKKFKAEFEIQSTLSGAVGLLMDIDSYKEWIHSVDKAYLVKSVSDSIYYYHFFVIVKPIIKKDGVVKATISQNKKTKIVYSRSNANVKTNKVKGFNRITEFGNIWRFTPVQNNKIKVTYTGYGNVQSEFTYFFIRRIILSGIYQTMDNMRNRVRSIKYQNISLDFIEE